MSINEFNKKLLLLLEKVYNKNEFDLNQISSQILSILNPTNISKNEKINNIWDQKDIFLITYADSIIDDLEVPLKSLNDFLLKFNPLINSVHILPFMPSSSDKGFSVKDYYQVSSNLGDWNDLSKISTNYNVMIDMVLNHASKKSKWFENFINEDGHGSDFFINVNNWDGIPQVVRPRTSELFQTVKTKSGEREVWCTFSHDQIDLDFKNPNVLIEFINIFNFYIKKNIKIFRLDAVAYIWKEENTNCINRPEAHYLIKIFRLILDYLDKRSVLITETNIPNKENLTYFGNGDEAHWIYNFTLAPLILYTLVNGDSSELRKWSMTMPPAKNGNAYFNFIASHDGIGLRPIEGYIDEDNIEKLLMLMKKFDGKISYRTTQWGDKTPYEINISFYDSMRGTFEGEDEFLFERFICAHAIMFAFEGVPAIYIHSLLGTKNNIDGIQKGGENRIINRYQWDKHQLFNLLKNNDSINYKIYKKINELLKIRINQPAFHPNSTQFTLNLGNKIYGLWRQDLERTQSIFCVSNITKDVIKFPLNSINLIETEDWFDIITRNKILSINGKIEMNPYETLWISNNIT